MHTGLQRPEGGKSANFRQPLQAWTGVSAKGGQPVLHATPPPPERGRPSPGGADQEGGRTLDVA